MVTVITAPVLPELERAYACPGCRVVVRFEAKDVATPGGPKLRCASDGCTAKWRCPWCHVLRVFREQGEA